MQRPLQKARNQEPWDPHLSSHSRPCPLLSILAPGTTVLSDSFIFGFGCWAFSLSCLWSLSGMNSGEGPSVEREGWSSGGQMGKPPSEQELASRGGRQPGPRSGNQGHAEDLSCLPLAPKDQ